MAIVYGRIMVLVGLSRQWCVCYHSFHCLGLKQQWSLAPIPHRLTRHAVSFFTSLSLACCSNYPASAIALIVEVCAQGAAPQYELGTTGALFNVSPSVPCTRFDCPNTNFPCLVFFLLLPSTSQIRSETSFNPPGLPWQAFTLTA
jgi:hypothetical protein